MCLLNQAFKFQWRKKDEINKFQCCQFCLLLASVCTVALCILSAYYVQEFKPIGTAHNRRAQPFVAAANIDDKRQVVSSSYNSPIGLYSSGNIQDALQGQLRGLIPSSPQK